MTLDRIIGGGQTIGTLDTGKKCLVWGGLPGEKVLVQLTKKKSSYVEGYVTEVIEASADRVEPKDPGSYLSTSPWQIMNFEAEEHYKSALIEEAFELHDIVLPTPITVWSDGRDYRYRNKVEFSFWFDTDIMQLKLAFFRRGSHGKVAVDGTSLAADTINQTGLRVLKALRELKIDGRALKTLMIRSNRAGQVAWQLYVKEENIDAKAIFAATVTPETVNAEVIFSNPKSPASVITKRLASTSDESLSDTILGVPFRYATDGFFQINLPVYEQALKDMREWVRTPLASFGLPAKPLRRALDLGPVARSTPPSLAVLDSGGVAPPRATQADVDHGARVVASGVAPAFAALMPAKEGADLPAGPAASDLRADFAEAKSNDGSGVDDASGVESKVIDLYSGVGTIGLTIGGDDVTLIESNESAVHEMERNIAELGKHAKAVLAPSENVLEEITGDALIIVDPPRAGLHENVIERLLETTPARIIYLSCNPVTQARDVARLAEKYGIRHHQGYNFFPRTPHIEHLVVIDKI